MGMRLPMGRRRDEAAAAARFYRTALVALDKKHSLLHSKAPRRLRYLDLDRQVGYRIQEGRHKHSAAGSGENRSYKFGAV